VSDGLTDVGAEQRFFASRESTLRHTRSAHEQRAVRPDRPAVGQAKSSTFAPLNRRRSVAN
jgi:hypothetical protein